MPVTARLSRKFYERLGDDVANELVDWFNAVDATYRADLDRLNEVNFQRFDAKVEQRFAEADAKLAGRLADDRAEMERRFAGIEVTIERQGSALRDEISRTRTGLMKWMFGFWATTMLAIISLHFG
ncbi:MAG: hypothetical protein IH616_16895 [Gemmatimonadales bacterium]|nr:hypothetical protein [Gemmatimonadales bacterium]